MTVLLVVSIVAVWVERNVVDGDEFADRSVAVLDSTAVRHALAETIVDELIAHGEPALSSFRSTAVSLAEELTATDGFKVVFRSAVRQAHDDVFDHGANRASLDLSDTLTILGGMADAAGKAATDTSAAASSSTSTTTPTATSAPPTGSTPTTTATSTPATAPPDPSSTEARLEPALEVLRRVPASVQQLSVAEGPVLEHLRLWRVARDLRWLVVVAPLATIAAAAVALVVGRPRRRVVWALGLGVAAAGVAVVAVGVAVPHVVAGRVGDPDLASATEAATSGFLADLRTLGVGALALGALLAGAATATGAPHLGARVAEAWRWLVTGPGGEDGVGGETSGDTTDGRTGRGGRSPERAAAGAGLFALGIVAVVQREVVAPLVVATAGGVLAYIGAVVALGTLLGPAPATEHGDAPAAAGAGGRVHRGRRIAAAVAGGAVAVVVLVGVAVAASQARADATDSAHRVSGCNGFAELCDRRLDQVAFAGAHNAMSAADSPGWLFAENLHGIPSQLEHGIRALLVKSHYGIPTGVKVDGAEVVVTDETAEAVDDPTYKTEELSEAAIQKAEALEKIRPETPVPHSIYLCHVHCALGATKFSDVLDDVRHFLDRNPREVIILFIGDFVTPQDTAAAFDAAGLSDRIWTYDPSKPLPTLGQMVDARQNLFVLSEHEGGTPPWYTKGYGIFQDTPFTFTAPSDFTCAVNRGPADAPLFEINHWITNKEPPSLEQARAVNSYDVLLGRVRQCQAERKLFPTIVAVNFAEQGDLLRVVDTINGTGGH